MAHGADYPGYSEPEPESRFDKGELKESFGRQGAMFLDGFLESSKMGVAAIVGGLIGANIDVIEVSGSYIPFLWDMVVIFVLAHFMQHFIRSYISEVEVLPGA